MSIPASFWQEKIKIGSLETSRFMAAPLDGVTDSPLRRLIREFSPDNLLMGEMRHISQVANEREQRATKYDLSEQPLAFQFSANTELFMDKAVEKVIAAGFCMINLNCGCPARTVIKSGSGSALMADLPKLRTLLRRFVKEINGRVPFTIKIRAGFQKPNAVEVAQLAQDEGVEAIMIHPRTQPGGFTSRLDFDLTAQVKKQVSIPVIFSGNINNFARAEKTYELTGVDGFMIGRALWGAPWKLREIVDASQGKEFSISLEETLSYAVKHFDLTCDYYGPRGFQHSKKQLPQYIRLAPGAAEARKNLLRFESAIQMRDFLVALKADRTFCT